MSLVDRTRSRYEREGIPGLVRGSYSVLKSTVQRRVYDYALRERTDADPHKILWVDPGEIEYVTGTALERRGKGRHLEYVRRPWYLPRADYGDVLAGEWDVTEVRFTDLAEWTLIEERFGKGIPWEETSVYEEFVACIGRGHRIFGCRSAEQLHDRFEYLDALKASIVAEGYRRDPGESPAGSGVGRDSAAALDEVTVNIGRGGELLHDTNGRHRLALANVLDIPEIPVLVKVRHAEWQRKRDRIRTGSGSDVSASHPDLADVSGSNDGDVERVGDASRTSERTVETVTEPDEE